MRFAKSYVTSAEGSAEDQCSSPLELATNVMPILAKRRWNSDKDEGEKDETISLHHAEAQGGHSRRCVP